MKLFRRCFIQFVLAAFSVSTALAQVTIPTVSKEVGKEGGAFSVNTGGSGSWTATTEADWITLNRASGNAGVSCIYIVDANFSTDTRTATILIAGNTFTVSQTGYSATITPSSATADYTGGSGTVEITVDAGISWTAKPNVDWLAVQPTSGMSVGSVSYTIAAHTKGTASRTGSITIAGKTFSVTQTGTDVLIAPTSKNLASGVGTFTVEVVAQNTTKWTVTPNASWISVVDSGRGQGDDTVMVAVGANPSAKPRTGTVTIGSKTLTIAQNGTSAISLSITPTNAEASAVGAYGNVAVYATPDAKWTAKSEDSWITVSDGASGEGNGNTKYVVTANPGLTARQGRILFEAEKTENNFDIEGDDEVDSGRFLYFQNNEDLATKARSATNSLNKSFTFSSSFDGTFKVTLTGEPFPKLNNNDWSFAVEFYVAESNSLNRLMEVFGTSIYVDENNSLFFDSRKTDYHVAIGQWNKLVFCHDANSEVRLYAGQKNVSLVANYTRSWLRNFTAGTNPLGFTFGYTSKPSQGYLRNGQFRNFQVWGRALSQTEVAQVAAGVESREDVPNTILESGYTYYHYRCNMNGFCSTNGDAWKSKAQTTGWSEFPNRHGIRQRAMYSTGDGLIDIGKTTHYVSHTYNFWVYLDTTLKDCTIFRSSSSLYLDQLGFSGKQMLVTAAGTSSKLSVTSLETNCWTMITCVADGSSIVFYLNGNEIGSIPGKWDAHYSYIVGGWQGAIDEITFVEGRLNSAQVKALYDETKPKTVQPSETGTIYHTVTQGVITPVVAPTRETFEAAGGDGSISVTVAANTQWSAKSSANWITFLASTSHVGSAELTYAVAPNPATTGRTATLTLAGKTVTVSQKGLWSQLTYDGTVFGETSGSGFISVQVESDGTWTAKSDSSWLTLLDTSGHGSAEIMFVVDDFNSAVASRTATVTIAGKTVQITQRGYQLSIDPAVGEVGSNAGAGEIGITAPIDAVWEAIVSADWITLVGGNMGVGSGTLRYTVADNTTGETRTGKIIISGQEYTVPQHPYLKLATAVDGSGTVTGGGDYETNARATLRAVPGEGYEFTHWSGDAVGVEPEVTITMDMPKTVTAHFIPEDAAERLAEEKAAQGGFYTREQMKALAMGDTVIEVDPEDGAIDLAIQLQESADLSGGDWAGVAAGDGSVSVDGEGRVHIKMAPKGNTAFYRVVNGGVAE
ncbi:MAG: hypothetical protein IKQ15_00670 [Kiritimatiellae bacterium]|nr:hypothetical protein [Kiritimatiellia bacterium]